MKQAGTGLAVLAFAGGVALAQERPKLLPTQDVDILYRVTRPGEPRIRERVRWKADDGLERVDIPGGATSIFDHKTHYVTVLAHQTHSYLKLESPARGPIEPDADAPLTRDGEAKVADLGCRIWDWTNPEDQAPYSVCVTDDGVPLRLQESGKVVAEAVSVHYHKLKPTLFEVPNGYDPSLASEGSSP
jgi:hypothetical protein